jgi:Na+-driven multidrug efflux pump
MVFSAFANFMGSVYVVEKRSKNSFITTMFGAVINVSLNLWLIRTSLGVQGAAIATCVSYLIVFVIRAIDSARYIPFNMYWGNVILNTGIILVQSVFMICSLPFNALVQAIGVIALGIVNFKFIKIFVDKVLSFVKGKLKK